MSSGELEGRRPRPVRGTARPAGSPTQKPDRELDARAPHSAASARAHAVANRCGGQST